MKNTIDFFAPQCTITNISKKKFGICDAPNEGMAFVEYENEISWVGVVLNDSGKSLNFTAIDHCVEIRRKNGDLENRCDGLLSNESCLIFVELKDQRGRWIQHAVKNQLQITIDYFRKNHDLDGYPIRRAYVCNRAQPQFSYSHKQLMQEFYNRNGVRLYIQREIIIK